jgi:uncharacterized membrane protein YczE
VLFFVWSNIAVTLWLRQHGSVARGFAHFAATLRADWMLLLILTDAAIFTLAVIIWLWQDLKQRQLSSVYRWIWLGLTIILGCPGLFLYLAARTHAQPNGDEA